MGQEKLFACGCRLSRKIKGCRDGAGCHFGNPCLCDERLSVTYAETFMGPDWSVGPAEKNMQVGAQLMTRDGRRVGNAVVARIQKLDFSSLYKSATGEPVLKEVATVVTDAGNVIACTAEELDQLFWPAVWIMDISTHPGIRGMDLITKSEIFS